MIGIIRDPYKGWYLFESPQSRLDPDVMDVIDPTEPHQPPFEPRQEAMRVFPFQSLGSRNCGGDTVDGSEIQLKRPVIYEIQ